MRILGIDLGIASVGWAFVDDKNNKIIDSGCVFLPNLLIKMEKLLHLLGESLEAVEEF